MIYHAGATRVNGVPDDIEIFSTDFDILSHSLIEQQKTYELLNVCMEINDVWVPGRILLKTA